MTAQRDRIWLWITLAAWLCAVFWLLVMRHGNISWFALGDTDDNLRMVQVRDWLAGQGWYDLRQYRLNAPDGADIHWSRLVDLPLAALMLLLRLFMAPLEADKWAAAIAPLIPLSIVMICSALTARRLIHPLAHVPALLALLFSSALLVMYMPLRIDHHGWQIAFVAMAVTGLVDPDARRGGMITGLATALSLVIGMEMLPYLALAGGGIVLRWVAGPEETARMRGYGAALGVGIALGYLGFVSEANRIPRCDALSPVWLSAMLGAAAVTVALSSVRPARWAVRLGLAGALGIVLAAAFAAAWPQCLSNLEGISPEAKQLWFQNIREVRPIYRQPPNILWPVTVSVVLGLCGYALLLVRAWHTPKRAGVLSLAGMALVAALMLLWQGRASAVAQLLANAGMAALVVIATQWIWRSIKRPWSILAIIALLLLPTGFATQIGMKLFTAKAEGNRSASRKANARCSTIPSHAPLAKFPAAKFFTFVDLSPRLIALTHHSAITGPYHRNYKLIVDVHRAFRAQPEEAHAIITRHKAGYLLTCPGSSETTLFMKEAPQGLYGQLEAGKLPDWLEPVALPERSPFKLWRIVPSKASTGAAVLDLRQKSPTSKPI